MLIKKYKLFMEAKEKSGSLYKFGCVMIQLNINNWDELTSSIDKEDIYLPEDPAHGIETDPHITLLFGLHKEVTLDQVKDIFNRHKVDIKVNIDGVGCFENEEFDVVKLNVVPNYELNLLHEELSKLPNSDKFTEYKPHITVAYVKKGCGKKYENPDYKYSVKEIGNIKYSRPADDGVNEKVYFKYEN
jgi:2'-5' RNA ligase